MNLKKILAFLTVYAIIIISVPLFFNDLWLKDFPTLKTYEGELKFSGERAYKNIEFIGINFPKRNIGSENAGNSANWVSHEFEQLGLDTYKEEFTCRSIEKLYKVAMDDGTNETIDSVSFTMNGLFTKTKGINVIGVSKGKSKEIIILGAHRDTIGTLEGAQDNASGTASMLELARVLTKEDHYYTYMFISFDGEEIGLKGSEAFVKKNSLKDVKLAMILDCVGYKDADTVGLYQFASAKGASPLWTTVLANNILRESGRKTYYLDNEDGFGGTDIGIIPPLMAKMISLRVSGEVNTDSGPFVDRNIPAVGFIAVNSDKRVDPEDVYHTTEDTISKVSKDALEFIGKMSEQYIKSIELNDFSWELKSNLYIVKENKYLDFKIIVAFSILAIIFVILLWFISFKDAYKNRRALFAFVRKEIPWFIAIVGLSAFYGFMLQVLRFDFADNLNIIFLLLLWFGFSFLGLVAIVTVRFILLKGKKDNYHEITKFQGILLNSLYFVVFIATTICFNIFVAIILVGTPILVMARVGYRNIISRFVWAIVLLVWFLVETILFLICIESYILDFLSIQTSIMIFIYSLLVNFTFVYVISTPFMSKKLETLREVKEVHGT